MAAGKCKLKVVFQDYEITKSQVSHKLTKQRIIVWIFGFCDY